MKKGIVSAIVLVLFGVNVYAAGDLTVGGNATVNGTANVKGGIPFR